MSALGQKQTYAVQQAMSALPQKRTSQSHVAVNSILRDCGQNAQHSTKPDGRAFGAKYFVVI
jgi:hypothetical protein